MGDEGDETLFLLSLCLAHFYAKIFCQKMGIFSKVRPESNFLGAEGARESQKSLKLTFFVFCQKLPKKH